MGSPVEAGVSMKDEILIAGSGAMATLFAARLSTSGVQVSMLGTWKEGLAALEQNGASLIGLDGQEHFYPVRVLNPCNQNKKFRFALVLVKSWQTSRAARQLTEWLEPEGLCLTLQNGLGNREILQKTLGNTRVTLGVTTLGGTLMEPGRVLLGGEGNISIEKHSGMRPLVRLLKNAGFQIDVVQEATSLIWGKLVINSAINPLSAVLRVKNGQLLDIPEANNLLGDLALETSAVAKVLDIQLPYPDPVKASRAVARRTSGNTSSMLQDVLRGAPTEIEAINGAIWKLGVENGLDTPYNALMTRLVRAMVPEPH